MKFISNSTEETQKIAFDFVDSLKVQDRAVVVGLYGDLGAGKTSFSQGVAKAFCITETVVSPTFVIEKIYELSPAERPFVHLIHIDAYRLEKSEELLHLGWEEIIAEKSNVILIEWPERVADIMPEHTKIYFKTLDNENVREIVIEE